jgi:hypothetical protein
MTLPTFTRRGLVLPRGNLSVIGDPCIVWDEDIGAYRMVLFMDPPGHGESTSKSRADIGPGDWSAPTALAFTNPDAVRGGLHKPFIVMDPTRPNIASRIDGRHCVLLVAIVDGHKLVHAAWAERLGGPWTLDAEPMIGLGGAGEFDEKHVDAVTGYFFEERGQMLLYYMGYPERPQPRQLSPWGNAQGAALWRPGDRKAKKLGTVLEPCARPGHWASGYVGGLQLLPGREHHWIGLLNASPTAPDPSDASIAREEPAPSLGGFAYTDEAWPVSGWTWEDEPIEWIDKIPEDAVRCGEGTNLWRHHVLVRDDGSYALYYNSGYYGKEQLYMKASVR